MTGREWADILMGIAAIVLSGGALTALVTWMLQRHKPAIDRQEAETSSQMTQVEMADTVAVRAFQLAESIGKRLEAQEKQLDSQRTQIATQGEEIHELKDALSKQGSELSQLRGLVEQWRIWANQVRKNWPVIRLRDEPPDLPPSLKGP